MLEQLIPLLARLCVLLEAQTEAISALAASNEAMVDELAAQGGSEPDDDQPEFDLSGKPIQNN